MPRAAIAMTDKLELPHSFTQRVHVTIVYVPNRHPVRGVTEAEVVWYGRDTPYGPVGKHGLEPRLDRLVVNAQATRETPIRTRVERQTRLCCQDDTPVQIRVRVVRDGLAYLHACVLKYAARFATSSSERLATIGFIMGSVRAPD